MSRIIGIDLGTTNSLGAVFQDEGPRLIPNALGNYLTPSAVGYLEDGRMLTGAAAREMAVTRPDRCALHFKRLMGSDQLKSLADREFSAPELSAMILKSIVSDCRAHLGEFIRDVVITVPAYFNDHQRKATRLAGELVGLNVRRIINEPTAAALTYGFHERSGEKKILVFDLGGGTFDVTLMEIFDGTLEIIATAGESQLGGQDFTQLLVDWALAENKLRDPSLLQLARLYHECEQAKLELAEAEEAFIRLPDGQGHFAEAGPEYPISRSHFEALSRPLIDRLMGTLFGCLNDAGCAPDQVEEVILVGGATRMPMVSQVLENYFGRVPLCGHNPDEVVALGAAIQAALIEDHELVEDLVMTDVCPFTLGVEISRRLGSRVQDGYYLPLIHRNTTIPVSREELLATVYRNQDMVQLRIFQGEARRTRDNLLLGELEVTNIPPGREGQPIYVRFTYDMNGILEVEALVAETGHRFHTVLTHHVRGLSQEQIDLALQRMQEVKFYPRDEEKHQKLLFFGEQLLAELSPTDRREMDAVIDTFEDALFGDSRQELELARRLLLEKLEELGFPYPEDENHKVDDSDFSAF